MFCGPKIKAKSAVATCQDQSARCAVPVGRARGTDHHFGLEQATITLSDRWEEKEGDDHRYADDGQLEVERPAPRDRLAKDTTDDWADDAACVCEGKASRQGGQHRLPFLWVKEGQDAVPRPLIADKIPWYFCT